MFDYWYEPEPPVMLGAAYSVAAEQLPVEPKPIGFIWPKKDSKAIVLATTTEVLKYATGND